MYSYEKVSSQEAVQLIEQVIVEVKKIDKQVAIAVSGPEGDLLHFSGWMKQALRLLELPTTRHIRRRGIGKTPN